MVIDKVKQSRCLVSLPHLSLDLLLPPCQGSISVTEEGFQSLVNSPPRLPPLLEQKQNDRILYEGG